MPVFRWIVATIVLVAAHHIKGFGEGAVDGGDVAWDGDSIWAVAGGSVKRCDFGEGGEEGGEVGAARWVGGGCR